MNSAKILCFAGMLAFSAPGTQAATAAGKSAESLFVEKSHGKWHISFIESPVSLEIPEAERFKEMDMRAIGGPRYFYFVDSDGITISGWYEQSDRYNGVLEFWKRESARFYANPATAPTEVVFGKIGQWEIVLYNMPFPKNGVGVNLRAEFSQAGTWIDLHMSEGVNKATAPETREKLTAIMEKIRATVSPSATVSPEELESALADLTDRIDDVDDRGYEKAVKLFSKYLWSLPNGAYPFTPAARPWSTDPAAAARSLPFPPGAMLDLAFTASIIKDDLHQAKEDELYRAWLIVIKYYEHYTDAGQTKGYTWGRMPAIEELIAKKKIGQLRDFAMTVPLVKDRPQPQAGPKVSEPPTAPSASRGP